MTAGVTITITWLDVAAFCWLIVCGFAGSLAADEYQKRGWRDAVEIGLFALVTLGGPLAVLQLAIYGLGVLLGWWA